MLASTLDLSSKNITMPVFETAGITFPATQSPSADPNTLDDYNTWIGSLNTFFYFINSKGLNEIMIDIKTQESKMEDFMEEIKED